MPNKKPSTAVWARLVAWIWLAICLAALVVDVSLLTQRQLRTDLFALLPQENQSQAQMRAREAMLLKGQNELLIMVGVPDNRVDGFLSTLNSIQNQWIESLPFRLNPIETDETLTESLNGHAFLLTRADEQRLANITDEALITQAISQATRIGGSALVPYAEDPLGLYANWLNERSQQTPLRPQDGFLTLRDDNRLWALMRFEVDTSTAMELPLSDGIESLKRRIHQTLPDAEVFATGVPLFTNVAASTAQNELNLIGTISALGVILLAWYWFSSLRTILSIAAVTLSAMTFALAFTYLLCGQVHLITMVFGMSLIGITVDYSAHYFCRRFGSDETQKKALIKKLSASLGLALLSTSVAFAMMALTPLPGLQQMAAFCVSGLTAAFISVFVWLPHLDRHASSCPPNIPTLENVFKRMPTWSSLFGKAYGRKIALMIVTAAFVVSGLLHLEPSANIRDLNHFPDSLLHQSARIQTLTQIPSTSQYFLVKAKTLDAVLQQEEALQRSLDRSDIKAVSLLALSDWVPSQSRQHAIIALKQTIIERLNPTIEGFLGASLKPVDTSIREPQAFLSTPMGKTFDGKVFPVEDSWVSIVSVIGLNAQNVQAVSQLADSIEGVQWIDTTAELSAVLSHYRDMVVVFLALGLLFIVGIVTVRFKKEAWRACLPTILGLVLTAAILGWLGHSVSLFTVLAGILLLGLGIDYGIFLTAHPKDHRTLVAVAFAALTTFLSFGLLAFSATPALHTFGLAIMIGQCLIWVLTPLWRKVS